ncbi:MAG: DoxX family protein [Rhizomicrobium sp.]|jgi:putative oxidoreductase
MDEDFGKLVARLTVGVLLLFHGVHKVLTGIEPIKHMVAAQGLPEWLSYGVYVGEVVGPILVIVGFLSRAGGLLIVINMIVAVALAVLNKEASLVGLGPFGGYGLEVEAFFLFSSLAVVFLGAGRFSVGGPDGRWN